MSTFDNVLAFKNQTNGDIQQLQGFSITQATLFTRNPQWVYRYPVGSVTYPEGLNLLLPLFGNTGAQSTGTAHTHANGNWASSQGWALSPGNSRGTILTISNTAIMDTVSVNVIKNGTVDNIYLEIFKQNPDTSLTQIFSVDISGSLTTGNMAYLEAAIPGGIIAQQGDTYLIRVRNSSTVNNQITIAGVQQGTTTPKIAFTTTTAAVTNQTSYSASDVSSALTSAFVVMWAALGSKNFAPTDQQFADDFNRSTIGGLWWMTSNTGTNQLGITNGQAAFQGATDGDQAGILIYRTNSDNMRVDGRLYNTSGNATPSGLIVCSKADMSNLVFLGVTGSSATIYSGAWNSLTSQATVSTSGDNDSVWSIYYQLSTNTYKVLQDGVDIGLAWTDSGNVVSHGIGDRQGGIRISSVSGVVGAPVDNWSVRDYYP